MLWLVFIGFLSILYNIANREIQDSYDAWKVKRHQLAAATAAAAAAAAAVTVPVQVIIITI
jgi:hypothetical protein